MQGVVRNFAVAGHISIFALTRALMFSRNLYVCEAVAKYLFNFNSEPV